MLHTLSHSPWQCDIEALLRMLREGDDAYSGWRACGN
jgi:tRNA 2-thiouridine synthesizing protein B